MEMDDKTAVERLALRYAQACDRRDAAAFREIFTEDAVVEGGAYPGMEGRDKIANGISQGLASMYLKTQHQVYNVLVDIDGETGTGEVYGTAHHITELPGGGWTDFIMVMSYDDDYAKRGGRWYFKRRRYTVHWTETRTVHPGKA